MKTKTSKTKNHDWQIPVFLDDNFASIPSAKKASELLLLLLEDKTQPFQRVTFILDSKVDASQTCDCNPKKT